MRVPCSLMMLHIDVEGCANHKLEEKELKESRNSFEENVT